MNNKFKNSEETPRIDSNDITQIMAKRPAMLNRDLLIVLSTLKGKLGHQALKANLAKAIAAWTNLLDDYFKTEDFHFIKSSKEYEMSPMISFIDMHVVISLICGKRKINEYDVNVAKQINCTLQYWRCLVNVFYVL